MNPYWKCATEPRNTIVCEWLEAWKNREGFKRQARKADRRQDYETWRTSMRGAMTQRGRLASVRRIYHVCKENAR